MIADAKSLRFLGEEHKLSVPFFQRKYVWKEENWHELLETFQNLEVMPFLGSIIIKEDSQHESIIIDGQQRLTTITILAKAIYDCVSASSKTPGSGLRNCVENFLFYRANAADDFNESKVRIEHSHIDHEDYEKVIKSQMLDGIGPIDLDTINEMSSGILKCYKYYCQNLQNLDDLKLKELFNSIFDKERKVFVLIKLQHGDINEQTIFDTINRAGIRLSTADIIKNNLFKHFLNTCNGDEERKKEVLKIYENDWENVFNLNQDVCGDWDTERTFGNVKHNNLEFLLYCVACIKWPEAGDMFSNLENVFEKEISQMGYSDLNLLIKEIKEYAQIFKKYILDFKDDIENEEKSTYFKYDDSVRRLLLILQKFGVQLFYPYILMRLKQVDQNETDESLKQDFWILESFVIRRKIAKKGTHEYAAMCNKIIKDGIQTLVENELNNPDSGICNVDIKHSLLNTKDDTAKMILFWIELHRRTPKHDINELEYKYTLEHIMPKKWENCWKTVPIMRDGKKLNCETDEGKKFRNEIIQAIGNKTLLTHSLNSSVKNSDFTQKINGISESKPGYKAYTSLLLTKEVVDKAVVDCHWDEDHILKRTQQLYNEIIIIWPSFNNLMPHKKEKNSSETEAEIKYTSEQLSDPLKLLEAMDMETGANLHDMITTEDFVKKVNVQSETVYKYIREQKIIPDFVKKINERHTIKYFKPDTVTAIAKQFGWTLISDKNRKQIFIDRVNQMAMSYSYKPVLLKAIFNNADYEGKTLLSDITKYFLDFYKTRKGKNQIVEKNDSVFTKKECTFEDAENVIITYPIKRFSDYGILNYDATKGAVIFNKIIWDELTQQEKANIIKICDENIDQYYRRLEHN